VGPVTRSAIRQGAWSDVVAGGHAVPFCESTWDDAVGHQHPEREPGIDDFVRQAVSGESTALDDCLEADLFGVANAVSEFGEGLAVVEIWGVNDVSGSAEFIGEGEAPGCA
jgi:hypothetical protein